MWSYLLEEVVEYFGHEMYICWKLSQFLEQFTTDYMYCRPASGDAVPTWPSRMLMMKRRILNRISRSW